MADTRFEPRDPDFAARVRASFARQAVMTTIGAELTAVHAGEAEIALAFADDLVQQHGYLHAGVITTILDSACGYAAMSLNEAGTEILTVEYKINLLAPASGERFLAQGRVTRPGRTLTVCQGDAWAVAGGDRRLIAQMQATMMTVTARPDTQG